MKRRATIREVAAHAGVSPSTVSRVLNGHSEKHMRPQTKQRVLEAIEQLNYTPVKAAQTLRRVGTRTLGVVIPDITNLYFALLVRGIESVAFERGFTTLICDSNHQKEREGRYLDMLLSEDVEGVLLAPVSLPDEARILRFAEHGVRIVATDRQIPGLPAVEADNRRASHELAEYILSLGYRQVAYVAGPEGVSTGRDRLAGFREALRSNGVGFAALRYGDFTFDSGHRCAMGILDEQAAEVIVAANDMMAFGVLRAAEERGRSVPRDLGVAGFDHVPHVPYATFMHPELTTVEVPIHQLGRAAATLLLDGEGKGAQVKATLIRGGTCRDLKRSGG
jgi:DNA-binding LacI/PurR family transcriptional regulator